MWRKEGGINQMPAFREVGVSVLVARHRSRRSAGMAHRKITAMNVEMPNTCTYVPITNRRRSAFSVASHTSAVTRNKKASVVNAV